MTIKTQIISQFGTNKLFKLNDVDFVSKTTLKSLIYRWTKQGDLKKFKNGLYYFVGKNIIENKIFYQDSINLHQYIHTTYIKDKNGDSIGFYYGQNYLTNKDLDTQISLTHEIYSNNISQKKIVFVYGSETFIIKKCKYHITNENADYLAFLYSIKSKFFEIDPFYDYGNYSNREELKSLLLSFDKNKLRNLSEGFSSITRRRLNEIYETVRQ
jgi:hypothetical protein